MDGQHCKERVKNKVSIIGVIELWGDGRDIPIEIPFFKSIVNFLLQIVISNWKILVFRLRKGRNNKKCISISCKS